jgi:hypothetical protein
MFQSFGLASRLVDQAYWVNHVCFWQPDPDDRTRIRRAGRVVDTEPELSEFQVAYAVIRIEMRIPGISAPSVAA